MQNSDHIGYSQGLFDICEENVSNSSKKSVFVNQKPYVAKSSIGKKYSISARAKVGGDRLDIKAMQKNVSRDVKFNKSNYHSTQNEYYSPKAWDSYKEGEQPDRG